PTSKPAARTTPTRSEPALGAPTTCSTWRGSCATTRYRRSGTHWRRWAATSCTSAEPGQPERSSGSLRYPGGLERGLEVHVHADPPDQAVFDLIQRRESVLEHDAAAPTAAALNGRHADLVPEVDDLVKLLGVVIPGGGP